MENIELLGYIQDEEVRKFYETADLVTVLAKYGEGFGLPIIEGYLYNKPVFASDICAIPEIIINKDFLVKNNAEDLESKIEKYYEELPVYNFKKYYEENFSYDKILEKYVKLTQITVNDIALYEDICSVEIKIKKPDIEILKFDLLYVWRDMEEKISENCIDGKLLNEMADIFSDIIKNEKIYYIEEKMTIYFDKKNYLWEMSEYNHDELIHSLTSFENFMEIIDEIRIEKS